MNPIRLRLTPVTRALLWGTVAATVLQWIGDGIGGGLFTFVFGLRGAGIARGWLWQPLSYMFLHGGLFHLLLNMLVLFFLGPDTERTLGSRRFAILYVLGGLLGGLGWLLISARGADVCIGASGAVFTVLGAFATLFPRRLMTVFVLFIPITLPAWQLALALGALELASLLQNRGHIANAAHLMGIVVGVVFALTVSGRVDVRTFRRFPRTPLVDDGAELDRILDKVARRGIGSLSRSERERLQRASRELRERY